MKPKILLSSLCMLLGMYASAQWSLTGNASTSPGTNFIGTTDGQALVIKTDNTERVKITDAGAALFTSPLGSTGSENIFTLNGGVSGVGAYNLFNLKSSGAWEFKSQWNTSVLGFAAGTNTLYSGPSMDIDFTSIGEMRTTNINLVKLRGVTWTQTEININGAGIQYKSEGSSSVASNASAHKFTVGSALTSSGAKIASFDNGGSDLVVITKEGNVGIGTATPSTKLHVAGSVRIADGTEGAGKVFTSDANGVGSWAAAAGIAIGDAIGSATAGRVLFTGTGGTLQQSADLLFDNTSTNFVVGPNQVISDYFGFAQGQGNFVTNRGAAALNGYGIAGGWYSLSTGLSNRVDGTAGFVGGKGNFSRSYAETVIGSFATDYTAASVSVHDVADRVFAVGIGTAEDARADALVIKKNGRVGIGTSSPQAVLHVKGGESRFSAEEDNIGITNTAGTQNIGTIGRNTGDASLQVQAHYANLNLAAGSSAGHINLVTYNSGKNITLMPTGGVGVGTTSPSDKLEVVASYDNGIKITGNYPVLAVKATTGGEPSIKLQANSGYAGVISQTSGLNLLVQPYHDFDLISQGLPGQHLLYASGTSGSIGINTGTPNSNAKLDVNGNIFSSGKIAIGTTDMTKISDYSLVVNGEALFTKARVKLYSNWPDYVFEDKYGLLPIAQLEQYIKTNKHLPGIPSAAEVAKEGIDLGGNQAQLLQKIEELTLYIIDQNKKIETLQKENAEVRQKLNLPISNQ